MADSYVSPHDEIVGNRAYIPYADDDYNYHCFASANYNPESGTDLAQKVWSVKRQRKSDGAIRIVGGGAPVFAATDLATVQAHFA